MSKCIVHECVNHSHQGEFVGDLCKPCYITLTTGKTYYSSSFIGSLQSNRDKWRACAEELADRLRLRGLFTGLLTAEESVLDEFEWLKEDTK